jgi:hypothetical protein
MLVRLQAPDTCGSVTHVVRLLLPMWRDGTGQPPNPRMQPTDRRARRSARPRRAVSALWNVGLCGGELEGSQLMRGR